jgi:hypothetical protein
LWWWRWRAKKKMMAPSSRGGPMVMVMQIILCLSTCCITVTSGNLIHVPRFENCLTYISFLVILSAYHLKSQYLGNVHPDAAVHQHKKFHARFTNLPSSQSQPLVQQTDSDPKLSSTTMSAMCLDVTFEYPPFTFMFSVMGYACFLSAYLSHNMPFSGTLCIQRKAMIRRSLLPLLFEVGVP